MGPHAVRSIKRTLAGSLAADVEAALRHELAEQSRPWRTPDSQARVAGSLARPAKPGGGT